MQKSCCERAVFLLPACSILAVSRRWQVQLVPILAPLTVKTARVPHAGVRCLISPLQSASLNPLIASFSTFLHNGHWASAEDSQNSCANCPCTVCLHDFLETSFELAELAPHCLFLNTCLRQTEVPFVEMEVDTGMPGRHRTATTGDRRSPFVQVL